MIKNLVSSLLVVGVLAACGGGGGGGGSTGAAAPVASTLAFPLQQAIRNQNRYGNSANYESHGTFATEATNGLCAGTMSSTNSAAATYASFEGAFAYSSTDNTTVTYTNCTPSPTTSGGTDYYDGNYDQVGYIESASYRIYGPWTVPATVHVGDAGFLVTEMAYTNSSKTVVQYRRDISYSVAADTASTAIVNIVVRYYFPDYIDSSGTHAVYTQFSVVQSRNRITAGGSLVELSTDTQRFSVNSTAGTSTQHHFVWNMVSNTPGATTSAPSGTANFAYTGTVQTLTVPAGATSVTVSASGGGGGGGTYNLGGAGGTVNASWNLAALGSPGSLSVYVAGAGATATTINTGENGSGAGGGGGATVVAFGSNQVLVIAGGGGGGGSGFDTTAAGGNGCGGNGSTAHGLSNLGGSGGANNGTGGAGGTLSGVSGGSGGGSNGAVGAMGVGGGGGGGGGSSAFGGGAGGTNNGSTGSGGGGGFGGAAGGNMVLTFGGYGGGGSANYGGGGGGGYGGGGAGSYLGFPAFGGGGGGGSTYIRPALAAASCVAATTGSGLGGMPHSNGQNGGVNITFN